MLFFLLKVFFNEGGLLDGEWPIGKAERVSRIFATDGNAMQVHPEASY